MIDRFELVLKKVPSIPQTRKKSRHTVSRNKVVFISLSISLKIPPDKSTLYSKLYLIAFLVQFILGTLRTPLTDNRTESFEKLQARLFEEEIYTDLIKCLRAMLTLQFTCGTSVSNIDGNAMQDRKDVVKNVN